MIRFDKLKIITNIKYISNINDKAFATQTINGNLQYYKYIEYCFLPTPLSYF